MSNDKSLNNVNNAEMIFSPKVMVQNFVPTIADKTQYLFNAVHSNEDIKFNGENFSLVHLNGNHLASNSKNNNKMNFAGGHVRVLAINKEEKKENEIIQKKLAVENHDKKIKEEIENNPFNYYLRLFLIFSTVILFFYFLLKFLL